MTNKEIMDFIFENGNREFTKDEIDFWERLNVVRKDKNYPWKTSEPYDYIAIGIYIGIKKAQER